MKWGFANVEPGPLWSFVNCPRVLGFDGDFNALSPCSPLTVILRAPYGARIRAVTGCAADVGLHVFSI